MSVVILHLSDLHARDQNNEVLARGSVIARAAFPFLVRAEAVIVVFSGDIAFSGKATEYDLVLRLVEDIEETLKRESNVDVQFLVAPGNHDCDLSGEQGVRDVLIENFKKTDVNEAPDEVFSTCAQVQKSFFEFRDAISNRAHESHVLWDKHKVRVGRHDIVIDLVNVSWMSRLREEPILQFPVKRFQPFVEDVQDLRITILHHPLNWYAQGSYRPFRRLIRGVGDIVLTGHEHYLNSGENLDSETGLSAYVEGGVLSQDGSTDSTFHIVEIQVDAREYRSLAHRWNGLLYEPIDPSPVDFRPLRAGRVTGFPITETFEARLNDPGAQFSHPGAQTVTLNDIFVYPDLQRTESGADDILVQRNSKELGELSKLQKGVLLRGDEQSGRSTLLRRLFMDYHSRNKVPVLLDGRRITSATDRDLKRLVANVVKEQFGEKCVAAFDQTSRESKILLIDNLDQAKVNTRFLGTAIEYLSACFGGVLATVGMTFELSGVLAKSGLAPFRSFVEYELLPFGYTRRYELAHRWVAIGGGTRATADETIALIDRAERIMTDVLGKNLVPSYPLYLLTLLQSIEAGQQNALQNSAYGYYYQYLITSKLAELRILPEEYDEFFHYCSQLAWFYKSSGEREIEFRHVQEFHQQYCREFVSIDFDQRLRHLTESHILQRNGAYLSFRYPYAYYFFLGKYLSERINQPEVRALVVGYCSDLALRDNANTVLFLAHHTRDPYVYECVIDALSREFSGAAPIELGPTDLGILTGLIDAAPQLVFSGGEVLDNRRKVREAQDNVANGLDDDDLIEPKEGGFDEGARIAISLNRLLKTVGILGQVLRNHYGSLRRATKKEILRNVFDGSLRGLRVVVDLLSRDKDLLIEEVKAALAAEGNIREHERDAAARRIVFVLIEILTYVFVRLAAGYVGSEFLKDVIRDTVDERGTVAYRLIGLAVDLDQGGELSLETIRKVDRDVRNNVFAQRLVRLLTVRYLYMFRTNDRDKQRLCAELGIPIENQRKMDVQSTKTKLIEGT